MTEPVSVSLPAARDVRVVPYCVLAFGALAGALVVGRPELVAFAVPFAVAVAVGLRRTAPLPVRAGMGLDAGRILEGDEVDGRIEARWPHPVDVQLHVDRLRGASAVEPSTGLSWSLPAGETDVELPLRVAASRWGRHQVGEVWFRGRGPLGLVSWTGVVAPGPTLRVLPGSERLTRLLDPSESRAIAGLHRSRRVGEGGEFAELRPYVPGDRLRDLNWGATARLGEPHVNRRHPERSGEVVIVIDAFGDDSVGSTEALARAARAAWAVASVHLQGNDRVGLLGLGRRVQWLHPASGRRARQELLEVLLDIGATTAPAPSARPPATGRVARQSVPASALLIALTPLHDRRIIGQLQSWRARGRSVAVVRVDVDDLLPPPTTLRGELARRMWSLEIDGYARELTEVGIPVVTVAGDGPIMPAVSALRRARLGTTVRAR